jgi:oligo-1,6-glucosidase
MKRTWWKESVVYQIYPRSFMDSNGDGIGDLRGIISRLDYLKNLGVDVVWLCPVYKSPNDDNGYDISDYRGIMDEFGTLGDWDELLSQIHKRGMKLIMDFVANHSSDEHPWFVESRSSRDNPYRDYYVWRPAKNGKEPNNWVSYFSGSVWEYDEKTDEYYLHIFSKKQPDLNWENEKVRNELYETMQWWLDKGIDGFRMDAINIISKADGFPSVPSENDEYVWGGRYFHNGPKVHDYLREMNEKVFSRYDIMTVGEMGALTPELARLYSGEDRNELNTVFHFDIMELGYKPNGKWNLSPWKLTDFKKITSQWQYELEDIGWNSLFLGNHDFPRVVSRFGNDSEYRIESAKMLATCLFTQKGTPYMYQGDEIGMTNVAFPSIDYYRDIETVNMYREAVQERKISPETVMKSIHLQGRDNARTPMQWSSGSNAGFTTGTPWIQANPNYTQINVEKDLCEPDSILNYYKKLIALRKENPVLVYGRYNEILKDSEEIFAYTRSLENESLLVVLNFADTEADFLLPENINYRGIELIIGNYDVVSTQNISSIKLKAYEARVYKLML